MRDVPSDLLSRPFSRAEAVAADVSAQMLRGARFVRVLPAVYRHREHAMTEEDWVGAARLVLPESARTTGLTRLRQSGLDFGPMFPLHFVVAGDHHLALPNVFLHRTVEMPTVGGIGVDHVAAYIAFCVDARLLDAVKVGDWLLANSPVTVCDLREQVLARPWRAGAAGCELVLPYLDARSASLPESEVRCLLVAAGLPAPEPNVQLEAVRERIVIADLWLASLGVAIEYEGSHHQSDRQQYAVDIERYAAMRRAGITYVQVTKESLRSPRQMILEVHRVLVEAGYDGPEPTFGEEWRRLFRPLRELVPRRSRRRAAS